MTPAGGAQLRYVPLLRSPLHPAYYVVTLSGVMLGSRDLEQRTFGLGHDFARGYGCVLDSGARPTPPPAEPLSPKKWSNLQLLLSIKATRPADAVHVRGAQLTLLSGGLPPLRPRSAGDRTRHS